VGGGGHWKVTEKGVNIQGLTWPTRKGKRNGVLYHGNSEGERLSASTFFGIDLNVVHNDTDRKDRGEMGD